LLATTCMSLHPCHRTTPGNAEPNLSQLQPRKDRISSPESLHVLTQTCKSELASLISTSEIKPSRLKWRARSPSKAVKDSSQVQFPTPSGELEPCPADTRKSTLRGEEEGREGSKRKAPSPSQPEILWRCSRERQELLTHLSPPRPRSPRLLPLLPLSAHSPSPAEPLKVAKNTREANVQNTYRGQLTRALALHDLGINLEPDNSKRNMYTHDWHKSGLGEPPA
jgi:hypothetical protein